MKSSLYITADDYGLHPAINDGILALHDVGIVNRTSIIVGTEYFKESVDALKKKSKLEAGIHLNLTDGKPILSESRVRSLVNARGEFIGGRHMAVAASVMLGAFDVDEIRAEWSSQIEKAKHAGLKIAFLNSHGHIHLLPQLQDVIVDLADKYGIGYIRVILNASGVKGVIFRQLSLNLIKKIEKQKLEIKYPTQVLGIDHQGHFTESIVKAELAKCKEGEVVELITHPAISINPYHKAWGYHTDQEYMSLKSILLNYL